MASSRMTSMIAKKTSNEENFLPNIDKKNVQENYNFVNTNAKKKKSVTFNKDALNNMTEVEKVQKK